MAAQSATALLLHGQPGSARDWDGVVAALGTSVRALAVDRPGWNAGSPATDVAGNANAALGVLDARGLERPVLVAHSFAGAVAARLAIEHPERVQALVLAAPSANVSSLYELDRWLAAPLAGRAASAALLGGAGLALSTGPVRRRLARELGLEERYLRRAGQRLLRPQAWRSFVVEQRALVAELPRLEERLGEISVPTTIVAGSEDRIVPLSSLRELSEQIPGSNLVLLPGAGHLLPLRRAGELASIIAQAAV